MWIELKDQKPADGAEVLVVEPVQEGFALYWIAEFDSKLGGFQIPGFGFLESGDISYWTEIPPPPKEK